jgi:hypothetical protein
MFRFAIATLVFFCALVPAVAQDRPVDENYRHQFKLCDLENVFEGHVVTGSHRCKVIGAHGKDKSDPNNVTLLARRGNGVVWTSKLSLDVDGSWAAWHNLGDRTTQKFTSFKWPNFSNQWSHAAQVDPDQIPFVVIPADGLKNIYGPTEGDRLGLEFREKTGLTFGDFGIVTYNGIWTPAIIADGGPFNKLGEGSSKLFDLIGVNRCRRWSQDHAHCIGDGASDPYIDSSAPHSATYVFYPHTASLSITAKNATAMLCEWARQMGKTGSPLCR